MTVVADGRRATMSTNGDRVIRARFELDHVSPDIDIARTRFRVARRDYSTVALQSEDMQIAVHRACKTAPAFDRALPSTIDAHDKRGAIHANGNRMSVAARHGDDLAPPAHVTLALRASASRHDDPIALYRESGAPADRNRDNIVPFRDLVLRIAVTSRCNCRAVQAEFDRVPAAGVVAGRHNGPV